MFRFRLVVEGLKLSRVKISPDGKAGHEPPSYLCLELARDIRISDYSVLWPWHEGEKNAKLARIRHYRPIHGEVLKPTWE
jgi:hypothetical protein